MALILTTSYNRKAQFVLEIGTNSTMPVTTEPGYRRSHSQRILSTALICLSRLLFEVTTGPVAIL